MSNTQICLLSHHTLLCVKDHLSILFTFLYLELCLTVKQGKVLPFNNSFMLDDH